MENIIYKECVVIGAGITGLAAARWLKKYKIDFVVLEKSSDIGGLWRYTDDEYGVMDFTHINVSKYNYCFSDHSFPENTTDYPHHSEMFKYIKSYSDKFQLREKIKFKTVVKKVEEITETFKKLETEKNFETIKNFEKLWKITAFDLEKKEEIMFVTPYVSIASGHHSTPIEAKFEGQENFSGKIFHSVKFKSAAKNNMINSRVLIVGIGNSAVDAAVNLVNEGKCSKVVISSRSGAWIIPNYISGYATDLYACRSFLNIPWKIATNVMEMAIKFVYGHPNKYKLNPKMRALQTQPTVSPTLIHHIQRKHITIKPNIKNIDKNTVEFENGEKEDFDVIILCTGYKIDLNYLSDDIQNKVFFDENKNSLNLFKQVFHPKIGKSLAFLGFIQPSSGGLITVSEMQARWHTSLMINQSHLPTEDKMNEIIIADMEKSKKRFYKSNRHTIQQDPILYNDDIGQFFGAKPDPLKNFSLIWHFLFSSCGPAQWRLNGPDSDNQAYLQVKKVPVTDMMKIFSFVLFLIMFFFIIQIYKHPIIFLIAIGSVLFYKYFLKTNFEKNLNK